MPIEVSCSTHFSVLAASDVTVAGGGTCDDMIVLIMFGLKAKLNQASPPSRRAATTPVMMKRLLMGACAGAVGGSRLSWCQDRLKHAPIVTSPVGQATRHRDVAALHRHLSGIAPALSMRVLTTSKRQHSTVVAAEVSAAWQQPEMINLNSTQSRRIPEGVGRSPPRRHGRRRRIEPDVTNRPQAGPPRQRRVPAYARPHGRKVRSYISAGLLPACTADGTGRPPKSRKPRPTCPAPAKSEHEQVVDELHLTPNLTSRPISAHPARIRQSRTIPTASRLPRREEATRRMTIANSLIDEALRGKKARPQ